MLHGASLPLDLGSGGLHGLQRGAVGSLFKGPRRSNPRAGGVYFMTPLGRGAIFSPPLISEMAGPIPEIQMAFDSPGKVVEGNLVLLTSGSPMTSQVRSKSEN